VIVYDGDCAFCCQAVNAIRARDRRHQFVYLPRQTPGIEQQYPELMTGDFDAGMRLFEPGGKMHIGADAICEITLRLPFFRWFSWLYRLPVLRYGIRRSYSWIAVNRFKLSRHCGAECKLPRTEQASSEVGFNYRMSLPEILISVLIAFAVALHGWANVAKAIVPSSWMGDRSWPFLAYGMYRTSYGPGTIRATKSQLFALTARGDEFKVAPEVTALYGPALNRHYLGPMRNGNRAATRRLADRINIGRSDPVVGFRSDGETYAITDSGVILESRQSVTYSAVD
jgi:predicted DCC family thiol-disulfide oxidoreductase YuxK